MSTISDIMPSVQASQSQPGKAADKSKKSNVSGKTVGNPSLSEKASDYYEKLKKKYSNMEFILVSTEEKEAAKAQMGKYAQPNKMVVLIDEEKIERMAEDETYRKQYEGIIANAASGLARVKSSLAPFGAQVKGYGMQVKDDGTASFFAVIDKSLASQRDRIEKRAEAKKEAKKAAEKKAEKKEQQEKLAEKKDSSIKEEEDTVLVTASSLEELISKVQDTVQMLRSDRIQTEEEKQVGQHIDFSV